MNSAKNVHSAKKCKVCGKAPVYHQLVHSENYPTYAACLAVGLRWDYYCAKHIPPITIGRIGGPYA